MSKQTITLTIDELTDLITKSLELQLSGMAIVLASNIFAEMDSPSKKSAPKKSTSKKSAPKKSAPKKGSKIEETLEEIVRRIVDSKKTANQSYYNIKTEKAYVASSRWKKTHQFFKLGDSSPMYIMSEKGKNPKLVAALKKLGFVGAKPLNFSTKSIPKSTRTKKTIPKKPKKTIPKKPKKLIVTFDEENKILKDSDDYVYVPVTKGKNPLPIRAYGHWNGEKITRLLKKDIAILEKRGVALYLYGEKTPTVKQIKKIVSDYRALSIESESDSVYESATEDSGSGPESEVETETEPEEQEENDSGSGSEEESEAESEVEESEAESEVEESEAESEVEESEVESEGESEEESESEEEGEEDGDTADDNEKEIKETVNDSDKITENEYKKYIEHTKNKKISNLRSSASALKISLEKLRYIMKHDVALKKKYPNVKKNQRGATRGTKFTKKPSRLHHI